MTSRNLFSVAMYRSAKAGAWAVAVSIALTGSARTAPLFSSSERVIAGSSDPCGSATCPGLGGVSTSASDSSNQAQASASANSSPALSASASGGGALGASATAEIDYFIEWLDPTRTAPIPTLVDLILHTAVSAVASDPNSFAEAIATFNISAGSNIIQPVIGTSRLVSLAGGAGPDGFGPFCQTHPCNSPQNFTGTLMYNLDPNVLYSVQIGVTATTGDSILPSVGSTTQSAEASLDPRIYLDPRFNIPGLTLDISQGLDNVVGVAAVPAPIAGSGPLFTTTGLAVLGLLGWRRKKKAATFAA